MILSFTELYKLLSSKYCLAYLPAGTVFTSPKASLSPSFKSLTDL